MAIAIALAAGVGLYGWGKQQAVNRTIDMAFRRKVHHRIRLMLTKNAIDVYKRQEH